MRASPVFSVITPVFNAGPHLAPAVRSALGQTCPDLELILIDDGSTDDAIDGVEQLCDSRVRLLRQPNEGAPSACNAGLSIARGAYVAFLDQDDLWAPGKLARHLECFRAHPDVDLTFTWTRCVGEAGQDLGLPPRRWRRRISFEELLVDNVIGASSSVAIRREAIERAGPFDVRLLFMYDLDLYLRVLRLRRANALAIPEVLTFYRRHAFQMSRDWRALRDDWQVLIEKFRRLAPEPTGRLERRASTNMTRYFAYVAYERRRFDHGCALLASALRMDLPRFAADGRNWKLLAACLAGRLLPAPVHQRLEAFAGIRTFIVAGDTRHGG